MNNRRSNGRLPGDRAKPARAHATGLAVVGCMVLVLLHACATITATSVPCSGEAARASWRPPLVYASRDVAVGFIDLIDELASMRVVFVGELHDRLDHHLNQLEIICHLRERDPDLAVAMEFFQQPSQSHLDAFVEGRIDEASMLRETEYYQRWGIDYRLYRPIMRYARENGIPLVALNLPSELTGKVGRTGIEGLSETERAELPSRLDEVDEDYRARIKAVYESHPVREHGDFQTFLEVQLLWDEGMAAELDQYLNAHPRRRVVVLAGVGHALRSGIPGRLSKRNPARSAIVLQGARRGSLPDEGDFLLDSEPLDLPALGRLGVMLKNEPGGVTVTGFGEDSAARSTGMREGDRILSLDGENVRGFADVKLALLHRRPGETVSVTVERAADAASPRTLSFDVTLR